MIFGGCIMAVTPLLTAFVLRDIGFAAWQYGRITGVSAVAGIIGSLLVTPVANLIGEHSLLLFAGVGRILWLLLIPLAPASTTGLVMLAVSDLLLLLFAGLFSPTFATYRMNATDDAHMSRVVMAWSITNKIVQPIFIAASGLLAAVTSAKTALVALAMLLLTATAFLAVASRNSADEKRIAPTAAFDAVTFPPAAIRRWLSRRGGVRQVPRAATRR